MKLTDLWKDNNFVINESTVEQFNKWFEKDVKNTRYSTDEKILEEYVSKYIHENSSFEDIYTVVTLINSFYSTRMGADDCFALSKILHENHAKIWEAINQTQQTQQNIKLVQGIIKQQKNTKQEEYTKQDEETKRVAFSFTTKYFSILSRFLTGKDVYPIFDSVVANVLDYYRYNLDNGNKKHSVSRCNSTNKKDYAEYVEIINELKPTPCTYKHLDNYLWKMGSLVSDEIRKRLPKKQKKKTTKATQDQTEAKQNQTAPNEPSWFVLEKYNISLDGLMQEIIDDKGGFNV